MYKRVIVIGPPGAWKSTFSRSLRDLINIPVYYLDMMSYNTDGTEISHEEFDKKMNEMI